MATARKMPKDSDRIPIELPLSEYFLWAGERNAKAYESGGETWHSPMWDFVRLMAAHPDLEGRGAEDALVMLNRDGGTRAAWDEVFPDSDDPQIEFLATWDKVRVPHRTPAF
jgi:hypothetical protein